MLDDCIFPETQSRQNGYARVSYKGSTGYAHKIAFIKKFGEVPIGYELHHLCENRSCVNPDHLKLVTRLEHRHIHGLVGKALEHSMATRCPKGHLLDGHNKKQRFCLTCKRISQLKYLHSHRDRVNSYKRKYRARLKMKGIANDN